jgi:3-oxoacyl-[acyl-carrier-protein] synthase-3
MFFKTKPDVSKRNVEIVCWSHIGIKDISLRPKIVTNPQFISNYLPPESIMEIFGTSEPSEIEIINKGAEWTKLTGISERIYFNSPVNLLAGVAGDICLRKAKVPPNKVMLIDVGTNTGTGFPSTAAYTKKYLADSWGPELGKSEAMTFDMQDACQTSSSGLFTAWNYVKASCDYVLLILAEKASELAEIGDWRGSNLFGDGAAAVLLKRSSVESFIFFNNVTDPYEDNLLAIRKDPKFKQNGNSVHKFVGSPKSIVIEHLNDSIERSGLSWSGIDHLFPHQPTGRSVKLFTENIKKYFPKFKGKIHQDISTGNISSASIPTLISKTIQRNEIKEGEIIVGVGFGSGLGVGAFGIRK